MDLRNHLNPLLNGSGLPWSDLTLLFKFSYKIISRKGPTYTPLAGLQVNSIYCNPIKITIYCVCSVTHLCPTLCDPSRLLCPWDFSGKNTGVVCHFLLQGIFPTQGSNWSLLHWQVDFLPLSHLRMSLTCQTLQKYFFWSKEQPCKSHYLSLHFATK